jgi:hypothetical protein
MRVFRQLELALAFAVALGLPGVAGAQGFDSDRAGREGPGFKAGRLVLHPGVSLEGGYDSNIFLSADNPEDSFLLRVTGYLDLATEPPERQRQGEKPELQTFQFRGGVGVAYYQYFTDRLGPGASADGHVDFSYNPSKVFSLQVRDNFIRTIRPFTNANTINGQATSYGRNQNTATLDLVGRSKSKVLEGRLGYTNFLEFFDSDVFRYGNSITHRVPGSLSWSFFPSSALLYTVEYANQQFDEDRVLSTNALLSDSNRVTNSIGYNGAITERLSLTATIGYAAGFYQVGDDFDGVVARVEARWRPRPTIALGGGYVRDYIPSFIGNFIAMNRLSIDTRFTLSGAFQLGLKAWVSFDKSGLALAADGSLLGTEPYRKGTRVYAGLFGEYRFKAWLALFFRAGYLADFTDYRYFGTATLLAPAAGYQRFDAWIGIRVFY